MDKRTEADRARAIAECRLNNLATRDADGLAPECSDEKLDLARIEWIDAVCKQREAHLRASPSA